MDDPGSRMDADEYTCPICLDVFYHAYTCRPCEHIFCGPCLRRLAAANTQNAKCPLCRKVINVCLPNYGKLSLGIHSSSIYSTTYNSCYIHIIRVPYLLKRHCISILEMTKKVKKTYPHDWLLRHKTEHRISRKLPALPGTGSGIPRRKIKQTASAILNRSAGVVFVALFAMLFVTILVTMMSFTLWHIMEQFGGLLFGVVCDVQNVVDSIWNLLLVHLFENRISSDDINTFFQALTNLSSSLGKFYNRTTIG